MYTGVYTNVRLSALGCLACARGTFLSQVGAFTGGADFTGGSPCLLFLASTFSGALGASDIDACELCPAGSSSVTRGAPSAASVAKQGKDPLKTSKARIGL